MGSLPPVSLPRVSAISASPRSVSLLAAGLALLGACRSTGERLEPASAPAPPADTPASSQLARFQALQAALADGEDELAGRILAALRAQPLSERERELVRSAERVLAGRELVRGLDLALESEPVAERAGAFRLVLVARSRASVRLALPPCDLVQGRTSIDARGVEGIEYSSRATHALADLALAAGAERRVELATCELPLGRALAVRGSWRLETRSGEIEGGGKRYPAANVRVAGCERERLSPLLPPGPAAASALAERLDAAGPAPAHELLELALRTPLDAREECLAALAPVVERLARETPGRVQAAEPALRWLTRNREPGPDALAWARYLETRARLGPGGTEPAGDGLDLPERPRSARREEGGAR